MGQDRTANSQVMDRLFRELVSEHADRIYNLALLKSNHPSLAEDICQETFIRVYKGLPAFRQQAQLGTWIYRIALNVCSTLITREARQANREIDLNLDGEHEHPSPDEPVEDQYFREVRAEEVRRAIAALPVKQADAITLYYLKEFQYLEVAEIMELPLNTVKSHIHRAKQTLRTLLQEVQHAT